MLSPFIEAIDADDAVEAEDGGLDGVAVVGIFYSEVAIYEYPSEEA